MYNSHSLGAVSYTHLVLSMGIPNSVYGTVTLAKCGKMMWDNVTNNF